MKKVVALGVGGRPRQAIAHVLAKMVNEGLVAIVDLDRPEEPDRLEELEELKGIKIPILWVNELATLESGASIETSSNIIKLHNPQRFDLASTVRKDTKPRKHYVEAQPWKRKKKGRS